MMVNIFDLYKDPSTTLRDHRGHVQEATAKASQTKWNRHKQGYGCSSFHSLNEEKPNQGTNLGEKEVVSRTTNFHSKRKKRERKQMRAIMKSKETTKLY